MLWRHLRIVPFFLVLSERFRLCLPSLRKPFLGENYLVFQVFLVVQSSDFQRLFGALGCFFLGNPYFSVKNATDSLNIFNGMHPRSNNCECREAFGLKGWQERT